VRQALNSSHPNKYPGYGRYLTLPDLGISILDNADYRSLISQYSIRDCLLYLAGLNLALQNEDVSNRSFVDLLFSELFPNHDVPSTDQKTGFDLVPICPAHFRNLIQLLLKYGCIGEGRKLTDSASLYDIGVLLLQGIEHETCKVKLLDTSDRYHDLSIYLDIVHRGYIRSTRVDEELLLKEYIVDVVSKRLSIHDKFLDYYGFSLDHFQTVMHGLLTHYQMYTSRSLIARSGMALDFDFTMGQMRANSALRCFMKEHYICRLDRWNNTRQAEFNMASLSERPLALYGNSLMCLDIEFLRERVARELWNLCRHPEISPNSGTFASESGYAAEDYVIGMLKQVTRKGGGVWMSPKSILTGKAATDALIVDRRVAVLFEVKSSTVPTSIKYGTSPEDLGKSLDEKFIQGSVTNKQGFRQIRDSLEYMLGNKQKYHLDDVEHIIPCLVVLDDTLTWGPCYQYMQDRAEELFVGFGSLVNKPVILHVEDIRALVRRSRCWSITRMILRLSRKSIKHFGTPYNAICTLWKEEVLEKSSLELNVIRPMAMIDRSIELLEMAPEQPVRKCDICDSEMSFQHSPRSTLKWMCWKCGISYIATEEEANEQMAYRKMILDGCSDST